MNTSIASSGHMSNRGEAAPHHNSQIILAGGDKKSKMAETRGQSSASTIVMKPL